MDAAIRDARPGDLERLPGIEGRAAARFVDVGLPEAAALPLQTIERLKAACREQRLLVAVDEHDGPVGFAVLASHEADGHLEELDVDPAWSGRGLGRRLIAAAYAWARTRGHGRLTLTTFRDVPFNAPFYSRIGFVPLDEDALTPSLRRLREAEREQGIEIAPRVAMALVIAESA